MIASSSQQQRKYLVYRAIGLNFGRDLKFHVRGRNELLSLTDAMSLPGVASCEWERVMERAFATLTGSLCFW